jgi:hypothetical protein
MKRSDPTNVRTLPVVLRKNVGIFSSSGGEIGWDEKGKTFLKLGNF